MKQKTSESIDLAQTEARLRQWHKQHDTPAKVAAAHRRVLLQ